MLNNSRGNVYMLSWYLDVVAPNGWGLLTNEHLDGGLPLAFKKRTGYRNVYQPFYTMFFNPLNGLTIQQTIDAINKQYHFIHFNTEKDSNTLHERTRQRQEMHLGNFSFSAYSENAQRQVKKAEKNGLVFSFHNNAREVVDIFRHNKGSELKEYKKRDFDILEKLITASQHNNHGFCCHVKKDDSVLASGFFLTFRNRIIFLKGGVSEEGKNKGAMYFLMHHVIDWAKDRYEIFDFGGSDNKNVGDFYRKLGGKDVSYYEIIVDQRNLLQKIAGKIRK